MWFVHAARANARSLGSEVAAYATDATGFAVLRPAPGNAEQQQHKQQHQQQPLDGQSQSAKAHGFRLRPAPDLGTRGAPDDQVGKITRAVMALQFDE